MANETIGQRIAQKRKSLDLSQEALGDLLEVSRQAVSKWESDAAIPEIDKIVTMSRLFGVSVGWLLGVEEEASEPRPEEPQTRKIPKWLLPAAAVCTAAALIVAGVSAYRVGKLKKQVDQLTSLSITAFSGGELLNFVDYTCTPWQNMGGADYEFTYTPITYIQDSKCELVIYLGGEEVTRAACSWDGHSYWAQFSLDAADGYECCLVQTYAGGVQQQGDVTVAAVSKLARNLSAEYMVSVDYAGLNQIRGSLVLHDLSFRVDLPSAFNDIPDLWEKFNLVLRFGDTEIGRIDLMNRSQYSASIDFSGTDVEFSTQEQSFQLPDTVTTGDELTLVLECGLSTGHRFEYEIQTWKVE